jgi:regulator-associated protein of mTOR
MENSPQCWRMKERMKTVSVALVMCLNVGVDPPGIVKNQPCARLECWVGKFFGDNSNRNQKRFKNKRILNK